MNRTFLHSTLRELQIIFQTPRFWGTFCVVVAIFTVTGAYGTAERMPGIVRLAYWLTVHAAAWTIAMVFAVGAKNLIDPRYGSILIRMMAGSVTAALPIAAAVAAISFAFLGIGRTLPEILWEALATVPLCVLFCLLTYMTMSARFAEPAMPADNGNRETEMPAGETIGPPPLLSRLKPEHRGPILHLTVEDHYTVVTTTRGRQLLLLRFSDALKELGQTPGLQVHRSHWVAMAHVDRLLRDNGKLTLVLKNGAEVPVSRSFAPDVRAAFD